MTDKESDSDGISILMVGGVVVVLAIIGALLFIRNSKAEEEEEGEEVEYEDYDESDSSEEEAEGTDEAEEVYTWNEFRSMNKGKPMEEISELWKECKEDH